MRIGFMLPHTEVCGGNRLIYTFANTVMKFGNEACVISKTDEKPDWFDCKAEFVKFEEVPKDLDILFHNEPGLFPLFEQVNAKIKCFYVISDVEQYWNPDFVSKTFKEDLVYIGNSSVSKEVIERHGQKEFYRLNNGIDTTFYKNYGKDREYDVCFFEYPPGDRKGTDFIKEAITRLEKEGMKLSIKLLNGLSQAEVVDGYNKSKIFIHAGVFDSFPVPQLEAMACGCAVITTKSGADYANKENCIIINEKDSDSIYEAIKKLLGSETIKNIASKGSETVKKYDLYNFTLHVEELLLKLKDILNSRKVTIVVLKHYPNEADDCIKSIVDNTEIKDYNLIVYQNDDINVTSGWNKCVEMANTEYVALLNADTLVSKGWLLNMLRAFEKDKRVAMVGPTLTKCATTQLNEYFTNIRYSINNGNVNLVGLINKNQTPFHFKKTIMISGSCFMIKKSIWEKVGKFDEKIRLYGNEDEYCYRLIANGYLLVWAAKSYVHHFGQKTIGKLGSDGIIDYQKERDIGTKIVEEVVKKYNSQLLEYMENHMGKKL